MEFVIPIIYLCLVALTAWQEGKRRTCGIGGALALCFFFTPLFGYILMLAFPLKYPKGCNWCGNQKNEAEYCGICGRNSFGEMRPVTSFAP